MLEHYIDVLKWAVEKYDNWDSKTSEETGVMKERLLQDVLDSAKRACEAKERERTGSMTTFVC